LHHHGVDLSGLPVQSRPRSGAGELHLIVDSTGLKLPVNHRRMSDLGIMIRTLKVSGIEMAQQDRLSFRFNELAFSTMHS
jgi:hypothetical protein